MTLRAVETMAEACIDELPDAMSNLQESLDRRGASVLKSPQMIMRVLQEALQVAMRQCVEVEREGVAEGVEVSSQNPPLAFLQDYAECESESRGEGVGNGHQEAAGEGG